MNLPLRAMRDVFITAIYEKMKSDDRLFFLSADFGSPALDVIRSDFPDKFINVGIAEQNLINIATGLALEGYTVFAYAIASFITMRCYEQIKINLSLLSQIKTINVNLIGVGAGVSYDVSGPSHHCLEDLSIMGTLPNMEIFSPSDYVLSEAFIDYSIYNKNPKYLRFDSKPLPPLYKLEDINISAGYCHMRVGEKICIVSTGYMTQKAVAITDYLKEEGKNVGLIDFFLLKNFNKSSLINILRQYNNIITIEEGFVHNGGLNTIISNLILENHLTINLFKLGMNEKYYFNIGSREYLHKLNNIGKEDIIKIIKSL
jgi:transketolase